MMGSDVKRLRAKLRLSQVELGQLLGAHSVTVSRWENDSADPSPFQAALLGEFRKAANSNRLKESVRNAVASAGIVSAIFMLLEAARE